MDFRSPGNPMLESYDHLFLAYMSHKLRAAVFDGLGERLKHLGINPVQMAIIIRCHTGDANTVTGLTQIVPMSAGFISRQVEGLVKKRLLYRSYSEDDRRVTYLGLTEEAEKMMPEIMRHCRGNESELLAGVTEEERKALVVIVDKILTNSESLGLTQ